MYGRFVGLDIGRKDARISLIKRGLRDVQLLQNIRTKSSEFTSDAPDSLNNLFRQYSLPKGDIAVSLSGDPISVRVIKFPFSDPKKIDQVYGFEIENISTFDPAEKSHAYQVVKSETGAEALVCVFEKAEIASAIAYYNRGGIDPKIVTYTPVALSALDEVLEGARPLLLVDIGEEDISFALFDENGIKRVRSSRKPIESFLEIISSLKAVPAEDFGFTKAELAFDGGGELRQCLSPIVSEIKKTLHFFETELKEPIGTVLLSGVVTQIPGLTELFKKEFGRDVKRIFIPDLGADNSPLYARAYALALYGSSFRGGYLNYRKDEFKYVGSDQELRKVFLTPAVLFALILVLLLYSNISRYFELKNEAKGLQAQIAQVVKETFPEVKVIPKPIDFMEGEVTKQREKLKLMQGVEGASTPLEVLRNISSSLPANMKLTVNEIKFEGDNKIKIQGVCDSYQEVTEIEDALSKSKIFESVTRDQTGNTVDGKTKFELALVLKSEA
ncbi:MAG TPA: GspL/Epsl periplasmic domain-containing protein [Thermodesulfobacteriota bacterium]|nr:GspL/Epsl periplasmic domain-containing protein [Thermodesulfobacteriota bacterium]